MGAPPAIDPASLREDVPCLLCRSSETATMHEKAPFRIVRCSNCSLVYTLPRLDAAAIQDMYQVEYWNSERAKDFGYTDYLADAELYLRTFRLRSRLLHRHSAPPGTALDVGCAAGFALQVLQEQGYDAYGVELSAKMAAEAGRRLGEPDKVHHGVLEPGLFDGRKFDLITMFDVVEHVEDPVDLLRTARGLLTDRGVIVLETQNVASLFARALGVRWQHYKFEEHLYHFDPRTMKVLAEQAGLKVVDRTSRFGGKYVSFNFIVERIGRIHPLLSVLSSPLKLLGNRALYVNVFDEMLVTLAPTEPVS